jgi:hypothetical protein
LRRGWPVRVAGDQFAIDDAGAHRKQISAPSADGFMAEMGWLGRGALRWPSAQPKPASARVNDFNRITIGACTGYAGSSDIAICSSDIFDDHWLPE